MNILITEEQLKRIVKEQGHLDTGWETNKYSTPESAAATNKANKELINLVVNMDPHTRNQILGIGALFIPYVGPAISAGIATYDANLYYKEGKKQEAAITMILGLLPGISTVISKIPGVGILGQRGMNILADKIAKGITKLTPLELDVLNGINLNKNLVIKETDGLIKRVTVNLANKTATKSVTPTTKKFVDVGDFTLNQALNKTTEFGLRGATYGMFNK